MTAALGHNNPPDPIDEIVAPYSDIIAETEAWLDGSTVENEAQMKAADELRKQMRAYRLDLERGQKSATAPLYDAYKAELERWKPTIEDAKRLEKGLAAIVDEFKRELAKRKQAAERAAWEVAARARKDAEALAAKAAAASIDAQREAAAAAQAAIDAEKAAQEAKRDKVKGMRRVVKWEIESMRDAVNWIARNDKEEMAKFATEYVRRNHKAANIDGVRVWEDVEAY